MRVSSPEHTATLYDALNRPLTVTTPDGSPTGMSYSGNQTTITDPAGKTRATLTDAAGRITSVTEAGTLLTSYLYDALNDLTNVCQGAAFVSGVCPSGAQPRTFGYDSLARLTGATNPESGATSYIYDNNGNLTKKTDANNNVTSTVYDQLNRITAKNYTPVSGYATPNVTYCYDGNNLYPCTGAPTGASNNLVGHLTLVGSTASTTTYGQYDALGDILQSAQSTGGYNYPFTYTYNLANAMTKMTLPSSRSVTWGYDSANRINTAGGTPPGGVAKNYATSIAYASQGPISQFTLGNSLVEVRTYDTYRQQPIGVTLGTSPTDSSSLNLGFNYCPTGAYSCVNNNGNLQSQTISPLGVTQAYTYDNYNRLSTSSEKTGATTNWSEAFSYDNYGNRWVTANPVGIPLSAWTVTSDAYSTTTNRLTNTNFGYDYAGNQTTISPYTVSYDAENRQTGFTSTSNGTATYTYDGDGRRVAKTTGGVTTTFVYDAGGNLAAEYSSTQPPSMPCETCYLTTDHLGSTRLMTDQLGIAVSRHDFLPFGEELATSNRTFELDYGITDNAMHRYTGQQRDLEGPGLDFFHARYFSGAQGRFTSPDPDGAGAAPGIPQLWNGYSYVGNSPQSRLDPDGLSTIILIDGVETDRPFGAFGLLGGGALAQCPNNLCSGVSDAGSYVQFTASAGAGETGYTQYQTTYVTSTMFGLTTGTVLTYPVFAPTAGTLPGFGSLVRGLAGSSGLGLLLGLAAMQNGSTPAARARSNPFIGTAGSTSTTYNPDGTPKQARRYGSDGYPETDVDYDHDHGQGKPHVHDWGRPAGGGPPTDRDRAVGRPARAADPKPN